jgi:thiol-disulfide isomerase/thioredoxin
MLSFVLRHALALIFVVSGVAKLMDQTGTAQAVRNFGIPPRLVTPIARLLPIVELGLAALLVIDGTARLGGLLSLLLLLAFVAIVGWNLSQGRRPECNCFGRIGGSDISGRTIARNVVLAAAAVAVTALPAERPDALAAGVAIAGALAAVVLAAEAAAGRAAVKRKQAALDAAFDTAMAEAAFEKGPAPDFALEDRNGRIRTLRDFTGNGRPVLLCFISPGCGPCVAFKPAAARWAQVYHDRLSVVLVTTGTVEQSAAFLEEAKSVPVLFDDGTVRAAYGVVGTPGGALISADGLLAGPPAGGEYAIRKLLAAALTGGEVDLEASEPEGAPAGSIELSDRPAPRPTVSAQNDEEGALFLIDEATGATASLNQIGAIVWECLDGEGRLDEIVADLADAFNAPEEVVAGDVLEFVRQVGRAGLLVGIAPELPEADDVDEHAHDHHGHDHHGHDHHGHDHVGAT